MKKTITITPNTPFAGVRVRKIIFLTGEKGLGNYTPKQLPDDLRSELAKSGKDNLLYIPYNEAMECVGIVSSVDGFVHPVFYKMIYPDTLRASVTLEICESFAWNRACGAWQRVGQLRAPMNAPKDFIPIRDFIEVDDIVSCTTGAIIITNRQDKISRKAVLTK